MPHVGWGSTPTPPHHSPILRAWAIPDVPGGQGARVRQGTSLRGEWTKGEKQGPLTKAHYPLITAVNGYSEAPLSGRKA